MAHLLECKVCGALYPRLIYYNNTDMCEECFLYRREEEAREMFEDESFDWYETED